MSELTPGWHFCAMRDGAPVLRDGTPLEIGRRYEYEGPLVMCKSGLHDSLRVIDALRYAPGAFLCRTLASGDESQDDKRVSRVRVAVTGCDVTRELQDFASRIAYCALLAEQERGQEPDTRSWKAVRVARNVLAGEATPDEAWAAAYAAWAAANAAWAAEYAAWAAANAEMDEILLSLLPQSLRTA